MKTIDEIKTLVAYELSIVSDPARRNALEQLLVEPVLKEREWDYGQAGEHFPYWCVAQAPDREIEFAYCEHGFGPAFPWGWLYKSDPTLGSDAQWNWYLEEAFVRSGVWKGPDLDDEAYHKPLEERFPFA